MCRSCMDKYYMQLATEFFVGEDAEQKAMERMCQIFDWPYSEDAFNMADRITVSNSRISLYPAKLNTVQIKNKDGTTYLDTIKKRQMSAGIINNADDIKTVESAEGDSETPEVSADMIKHWGYGYSAEQYKWLEDEYASWISRNECKTKTQEELYRNICIAMFNVRQTPSNGKIGDAMDTLQKLMNAANILPKQVNDNAFADTQTFGTLLKKYEETRPVPEPAAEWKDVDGVRKYINTWFRGGLAKALHIKNDNAKLYDEAVKEMQRYTVPKPSFKDEEESVISVFDDNKEDDGGDGKRNK